MAHPSAHVLVVTFPAQGHINPALQFAKRLVAIGVQVTLATSIFALKRLAKGTTNNAAPGTPKGLSLAGFSDGFDDGFNSSNFDLYFPELLRRGPPSLAELIKASAENGEPFDCVVYCTLLPWVPKVARELHIPSVLLWNQPATVLSIYYHCFNRYGDEIKNVFNDNDAASLVKLPGLPPLGRHDLPSFFSPANTNIYGLEMMKQHIHALEEEEETNSKPKVLVNTFDALETDALKYSIEKYNLVGVGPLIPSAFLDGKDPSDSTFGGDLVEVVPEEIEYINWLNSKPESSVVYISFGSISTFSEPQMGEIARALLNTGRPFLWVIREQSGSGDRIPINCRYEELEKQGKIVPWCSQVKVLSHPAVACFVTHCGWNSTFESLASGVPVVAFPQWTDQMTNAKLVEDLWKTGVRVKANDDGLLEEVEIKRCLGLVMGDGERGKEMRRNAVKWKDLARRASTEGGSSDSNLKAFVDEMKSVGSV